MTNFNNQSLVRKLLGNSVYPLLSVSNNITDEENKYNVFSFYEGYVHKNKKFIKSISKTNKILLHGNLNFESKNCKPFDYFRYEYVYSINNQNIKLNDTVSDQYNFICLNATSKLHRMFTVSELYKRNLMSFGKVSLLNRYYGNYDNDLKQLELWQPDQQSVKYIKDLYTNNKKLVLDYEFDNEHSRNDREQSNNLYQNILVSLITESYGHTNDVGDRHSYTNEELGYNILFVTEKSYKAFANLQIPIWIALPGTVKYFRQQGFDVFDDVIDHTYDNQTDHVLRYIGAVNELERFVKEKPFVNHLEKRLRENKEKLLTSNIKELDIWNIVIDTQ